MEVSKYNVKIRALLVFIMLIFFGLTSKAQLSSSFIGNSNMFTIAEEVLFYYDSYIGIPDNDVRGFIYGSQLSGITNPDIQPPTVSMINMDENTATFFWWGNSSGLELRIRYLSLRTGAVTELYPTTNTIILPNSADHRYVYLFTYVKIGGDGSVAKSVDYIIIEENPIIRELPALACNCPEDPTVILDDTPFADVEQTMNNILIDDKDIVEDQMYKVEFRTGNRTGFYHIVSRGGKSPFRYDVSSREGCISNMIMPENEFLFYGLPSPGGDSSVLGFSLAPDVGLRMEWFDQSVNGTIRVTECGPTLSPEFRSAPSTIAASPSLHHFPNPTSGSSTLQYELAQDGPINLWITDARGQIVSILEEETQKISGSYSVELDLNKLPNGLYTAHLQIAGQRQALRLLKVN